MEEEMRKKMAEYDKLRNQLMENCVKATNALLEVIVREYEQNGKVIDHTDLYMANIIETVGHLMDALNQSALV